MPLMLQIHDQSGTPRTFPNGCGGWHLMIAENMLAIEAAKVLGQDEIDWELADRRDDAGNAEWRRMLSLSRYGSEHDLPITETFTWEDPADGECFTFNPGDRVVMWRS